MDSQIIYDNGDVQGTNVVLLNENPVNISSYEELNIVEETTVDNNEGTYLFDDLSPGTYFVAAYRDENGSGELEFDEFPIEPANVYGEEGVSEAIVVEDSSVTGINIDLSYVKGDYSQYIVNVEIIDPIPLGPDGSTNFLEGVLVVLYGKSDEQIEVGITDAFGQVSFDNIFDGENYLEVIPENDTYKGAILPFYRLRDDMDTNDDMSVSFRVPMFTESYLEIAYGSNAENELLLGIVPGDVGGQKVTLNPSVADNNIAYDYEMIDYGTTIDGGFTFDGYYETPDVFPVSTSIGYLLGIKNISSSINECSLSLSGESDSITFRVKLNRLITVIDQSDYTTTN